MKFRSRVLQRVLQAIAPGFLCLAVAGGCGDNRSASAPAAPRGDAGIVDPPGRPPRLMFSEVMYHPVLDDGPIERHEFVEIFNASDATVDLAGWTLAGQVDFTFPLGATIGAGEYRVVARDRAALMGISAYALTADQVLGDYSGAFSNAGGTVSLKGPGRWGIVDRVVYDDQFPWPMGADALGAGRRWLGMSDDEMATHRYRGRSLERVSVDVATDDLSNWVPSPLDGATPARPNSVSGVPPALVETLSVVPSAGGPLVTSVDEVTVRVHLVGHRPVTDLRLEWFVDDIQRSDEEIATTSLQLDLGELIDGNYAAVLPPQPATSIVRFRILGTGGGEDSEVISPRPSDPLAWHSYFVGPIAAGEGPAYAIFIEATAWTRLWQNINFSANDRRVVPETSNGRTVRCTVRESWDDRVPAVFVADGQVYDVFVRYQGSRYNRINGSDMNVALTSIAPLPSLPTPLKALAWNVDFPRYKRFQGRSTVILNKLLMTQSCPGLDALLGDRLYSAVGIPVSKAKYVRLFINGGYFNYGIDIEQPNDEMMERYLAPGEAMGDLFKADGSPLDEGPWGWSDGRVLTTTACPHDLATRYAYTYERKSNTWDDHRALKQLIEDVNAARAAAVSTNDMAPLRQLLSERFDVPAMLNYLAVRNWSSPWDEAFHNYNLYRRASGKWMFIPWDLDKEFGEQVMWVATKSFFLGEEGDPDNYERYWNRLKDAFIKAFRSELGQRILELSAPGQPLDPEVVKSYIDDAAATFDTEAAAAAPILRTCDFATERDKLKGYADARHQQVLAKFGPL